MRLKSIILWIFTRQIFNKLSKTCFYFGWEKGFSVVMRWLLLFTRWYFNCKTKKSMALAKGWHFHNLSIVLTASIVFNPHQRKSKLLRNNLLSVLMPNREMKLSCFKRCNDDFWILNHKHKLRISWAFLEKTKTNAPAAQIYTVQWRKISISNSFVHTFQWRLILKRAFCIFRIMRNIPMKNLAFWMTWTKI